MAEVTLIRDIVINRCHGGFGLSPKALRDYADRKGLRLYFPEGEDQVLHVYEDEACTRYFDVDKIPRDDPDLIEIVRTLGQEASGSGAMLKIVQARVVIEVESHDGYEHISGYCLES